MEDGVVSFTPMNGAPAVNADNALATISNDNKTVTITASGAEFFNGKYNIVITSAVEDADDNAMAEYTYILDATDNTRPTLTGPVYEANDQARFTFSEAMNIASDDALEALLTVTDENGDPVDADANDLTDLAADGKSFVFDTTAIPAGETYTIKLTGAADYAGNLITPNPVTFTVENKDVDTTAPSVTAEVVREGVMKLTFSEKINVPVGGVIGTYDIGGGPVDIDTIDGNATIDATGKVVTVNSAGFTGLLNVTIAGYNDLAGNAGTATSKVLNFVPDNDGPTVSSFEIKKIDGVNNIVVTFNEDVALSAGDVDITGTFVDEDGVEAAVAFDDATSALYDPDEDGFTKMIRIPLTGAELGTYEVTINTGFATDLLLNGSVEKEITFTLSSNTNDDTVKPKVSDGVQANLADDDPTDGWDGIDVQVADNNTVEVEFSEEVDQATALNVANYLVEGKQVFTKAVFTDANKDTVRLTLKEGEVAINSNYQFTIKNVKDVAGNVMDTVNTNVLFTENVRPTATAELTDLNTITVTFSEPVTVANFDGTDVDVFVGTTAEGEGAPFAVAQVNVPSATDKEFTITLTDDLTPEEYAQTITIRFVAGTDIDDANGNVLSPVTVTVQK
ncbi:Ig-like domain-containing protein [Bacillota bacterium LX-D]|nr:Ig-like domain-containing protein [Bacillota bacterium LX-D]